MNKEYNLERHFEIKHADKVIDLIEDARKLKITDLLKNLKDEQKTFFKCNILSESATRVSYRISQLIASSSRPFTDGEFVKDCLLAIFDEMCPEKKHIFNSISLSRNSSKAS